MRGLPHLNGHNLKNHVDALTARQLILALHLLFVPVSQLEVSMDTKLSGIR